MSVRLNKKKLNSTYVIQKFKSAAIPVFFMTWSACIMSSFMTGNTTTEAIEIELKKNINDTTTINIVHDTIKEFKTKEFLLITIACSTMFSIVALLFYGMGIEKLEKDIKSKCDNVNNSDNNDIEDNNDIKDSSDNDMKMIRTDMLSFDRDLSSVMKVIKNYKHLHVKNIDKFEDLPVSKRNAIRSMFIKCSDLQIIMDYIINNYGCTVTFAEVKWTGAVLCVKYDYWMYPSDTINILRIYIEYLCRTKKITHDFNVVNHCLKFEFTDDCGYIKIMSG